MPIYDYKCMGCGKKVEIMLPIGERNNLQEHSCGAKLERLISIPQSVIFTVTGRDKILNTLNYEHGKGVRSERSKLALAKGLDLPHTTIGRGFG